MAFCCTSCLADLGIHLAQLGPILIILNAGMEWLHSCPLDDDLVIGKRQSSQAGPARAEGDPDVNQTALKDVCIL